MLLLFSLCVLTILYTYFGYPLLLWLLTPRRPRPEQVVTLSRTAAKGLPSVTLLITAHNEAAVIARKLDNSLALDYPPEALQILVAADGTEDNTADIVRGYAERGVELSYSPERRGKTAALNRAVPLARGEIVVFSDANNLYSANALRELVAALSDSAVGAATGAKTIAAGVSALGESEGLYWKYESFIKQCETRLGTCTGVAGEILAVRRALWEPVPESIINDDFYMALRLIRRGQRVVYAPAARSVEHAAASVHDEAVRRARIVVGRYQAMALAGSLLPWNKPLVVWQIVSHKFLRPLVPLAMLGALAVNAAAVLWPAPPSAAGAVWLVLLIAQFLFYASALLGGRLGKRGLLGKVLYVPAFFVYSNWATLMGLYRFLTQRQTSVWQRARREGEK